MTNALGPSVSFSGQVCLDAQTEDAAFQSGPMTQTKNCESPKFAAGPDGGLAFDTACKTDGRTVTVHATLSGDFHNAYAMDVTSRSTSFTARPMISMWPLVMGSKVPA